MNPVLTLPTRKVRICRLGLIFDGRLIGMTILEQEQTEGAKWSA